MKKIQGLSRTNIQKHATAQSFSRGEDIYESGMVLSVVRRGNRLYARVQGSSFDPYHVEIDTDEGGVTDTECNCPYDREGWCKHIVATLLACVEKPEDVAERPEIRLILEGMDREKLLGILQKLIDRQPELISEIEYLIEHQQTVSEVRKASAGKVRINVASVRRQIRHILDGMEGYWNVDPVVEEIDDILENVRTFLSHDDGRNALAILEAVTDELLQSDAIQGYGEIYDLFYDLDDLLPEALLSVELDDLERKRWEKRIVGWLKAVEVYGIDDCFVLSETALKEGWDEPELVRAMKEGNPDYREEPSDVLDDLIDIRLTILERREQFAEYLNLARAAWFPEAYLPMLVRCGQVEQAMKEYRDMLENIEQAFQLAQTLREHGHLQEALEVGRRSLNLRKGLSRHRLAAWVSELAEGLGETEAALEAAIIAFRDTPGLEEFQKVQELAGEEQWPGLRKKLLDYLRKGHGGEEERLDIFLHEGLMDDAIPVVEKGELFSSGDHLRVIDAAVKVKPDWVIRTCKKWAERIVDAGDAKNYDQAIQWLEKVRDAYETSGRDYEWTAYRRELIKKHTRKYKFKEMLYRL